MSFLNFFSKKKQPEAKKQPSPQHNRGGLVGYLGLAAWFDNLPKEMKTKVRQYSNEGQELTTGHVVSSSLTQRKFLWTCASNALYENDSETAIYLAQQGVNAQGDWVDLHFVYSTLIEAYEKLENWVEAKRYSLEELKQFELIGQPLKDDMGGEFPPSLRCRDTLLDILTKEGNVEEIREVFRLFTEKKVMSDREAKKSLKVVLLNVKELEILKALEGKDSEKALELADYIVQEDKTRAAGLYKAIGNFFLEQDDKQNAFEYLSKALAANPTISGVKRNLQRLAKELHTEVQLSDEQVIATLRQQESDATEWWAKRDLANEYIKVKCYDDAWRLFNQAILLRLQGGGPCDTIYPHMAKMREKEGKFLDALMLYLLGYQELRRTGGVIDPPQYVKRGIDRCLKKIGRQDLDHSAMFDLAQKAKSPDDLQKMLAQLQC